MKIRILTGASAYMWQALFAALVLLAFSEAEIAAETRKPLTLDAALKRAINADFAIPAERARIRGAEAGVRQANRPPNPVLGVEVENFAGSGQYRGFRSPESTAYIQQTFEMGNRREARTGVARSELNTTKARGAIRVLDLLREVELAWVDVVVASAQVRVAEDRLAVAQELQKELTKRGQTGRDPEHIQSRAEAQVALERITVDQARSAMRIAKENLAAYWKGSANFDADLSAFDGVVTTQTGSIYNADIMLLQAERDLANAKVTFEKSKAIPDPSIKLGVRHYGDTRDGAVVAGLSIPIPLFDQNKDNIDKAEAERKAADLEVKAAQRSFTREVNRLRDRLKANAAEAKRIQSEVIPKAQQAVELVRNGMERGAFSYLEFVDAQRSLNDARLRRIEVLKAFHQDNATVSRLVGRHTRLQIKRNN